MSARFHMQRIAPEANAWRFYAASVQPNLFGGFDVVREWGRIGSAGRMRVDEHASEAEADALLMKLRRMKERRGYA